MRAPARCHCEERSDEAISNFIMNSPFEKLADLFLDWNSKLNLSAIRTKEGVMIKHIADSLLIQTFGWIKEGDRVLDLGTGGGFPGLALAIAYPKTHFTLCDATEKKLNAVESMAKSLQLTNVFFLLGRAEELGRDKKFREHFDVVVARALGKWTTVLEYTIPFVRVNGKFIAYQGPEVLQILDASRPVIRELSAELKDVRESSLPENQGKRVFVVIKKISPLSQRFPRATGIPQKNPLSVSLRETK